MFLNRKLLSYTKQRMGKKNRKFYRKLKHSVQASPFFLGGGGGGRMGGRKRIDDVGWSGKQEPLTEKDVVRNPV